MAQTLSQMITRVRARLGVTTDDELFTDSTLTISINNGLAALSDERDWPWLEALTTIDVVAGTTEYPIPDNTTRIHMLSIEDTELQRITPRDSLRFRVIQPQRPYAYSLVGANIVVAPEPAEDETMDVWYQTTEAVLALTTDTVLCPDHHVDIAVTYAAIDASLKSPDRPHLAELYRLKDEQLKRLQDQVQRSDIPARVFTRSDNWIG